MRINYFLLVVLCLAITLSFFILTCAPKPAVVVDKVDCGIYKRNNYKFVSIEPYISIVEGDTITLNQAVYWCTYSSLYTQKGMFDQFGKWDEVIYPENKNRPILFWENRQLLEENNNTFDVYAWGSEDEFGTYSAVMVYDENSNDALTEHSPYKQAIMEYFGHLIKSNKEDNDLFYRAYWKMADPAKYKLLYGKDKGEK